MTIITSDGVSLEYEIAESDAPRALLVLCHPHPLHGGTMRSLVTSEIFRSADELRCNIVRFNFRGVGLSAGEHDHGMGEQLDLEAVRAAATARFPMLPAVLVGWSFGGGIAASSVHESLNGWFLIAPAFAWGGPHDAVALDPRPKWVISGARDTIVPPSALEHVADWTNTTSVEIAGADHFFVGKTHEIAQHLDAFISAL